MEDFDADLYVKSMKEEIIPDLWCTTKDCFGKVSKWDHEMRGGQCSECYWDRGPVKNPCLF